jgi:hypothetical protein
MDTFLGALESRGWTADAVDALRSHERMPVGSDLRFGAVYTCDSAYDSVYVRFPAQGRLQFNFQLIFPDMVVSEW